MINRKLLEVLVRFDEEERKRFDLFLRSPYFNAGSNATQVVELYQYILRYGADENHPELSKPVVFKVFYPGKVFKENEKSALDTLTSDLFRLVREFLVQQDREKAETEVTTTLPLLRFYRKFGLEERYIQTLKSVKKVVESQEKLSSDSFYDKFRLEEEITIFRTINNTYEDDTNISSMLKSLDIFFILSKLVYTTLLNIQKRVSSGISNELSPLHDTAIQMARDGYCDDVPLAGLLLDVLHISEHPDETTVLSALGQKLKVNKNKLNFSDYKNIQTTYRQYWAWKYMRSGLQEDKEHLFSIFKDHLEEGVFYFDNKLNISTLTSLTNNGLSLKEYDWVRKLLENHPVERLFGTKYLAEGYDLNWAEYFLALKKYDEAQEHLVYRMFENPIYSISAETILLRIYYETENELLDSRIKAVEQKIRRTAFSDDLKKSLQLFIQKLDKLNKYRFQRSSPKFAKLVEEIKTTPGLGYRNWLLEKVTS